VYRDCQLQNPHHPGVSSLCDSINEASITPNITQVLRGCINQLYDGNWCYTRTHPNRSGMVGFYGECAPTCQGQVPTRDSPHNLASKAFSDLWHTNVFDLKTWGSGICHTYHPPEKSLSGSHGLLYALIGDRSRETHKIFPNFHGLDIYMHDRGKFWPGLSTLGKIHLGLDENVEVTYSRTSEMALSTDQSPCSTAANYSITSCLQAYVERQAGCRLDWFDKGIEPVRYCDGADDFLRYMKILGTIEFNGNVLDTNLRTGL